MKTSQITRLAVSLSFLFLTALYLGCPSQNSPTSPQAPAATATQTNSPTCTLSPTPTATVYTFTPQGFEGASVPAGWTSWAVGATFSPLALSSAQAHTGSKSAYANITYSGANQLGQIYIVFNPAVNLTGKNVTLWYYLDKLPASTGNQLEIYANSLGGDGGADTALVIGTWIQITYPLSYTPGGVNPSSVWEVGIVLYTTGAATGPFNTVNLYVDDVSIQ